MKILGCPAFFGKVKNRLHIRFEDPAAVCGSESFVLSVFHRIRDEIKRDFKKIFNEHLKPQF